MFEKLPQLWHKNLWLPIDVLSVSGLMICNLLSGRLGILVYSLIALPGTFFHELSHFLVARIMRARPSFPNLIPVQMGNKWRLGSVVCRPGLFSCIPIALAPLLLFPFGVWYAETYMLRSHGLWYCLHSWVVSSLFVSGSPSGQDWRIAAPALILIGIAVWAYWKGYYSLPSVPVFPWLHEAERILGPAWDSAWDTAKSLVGR